MRGLRSICQARESLPSLNLAETSACHFGTGFGPITLNSVLDAFLVTRGNLISIVWCRKIAGAFIIALILSTILPARAPLWFLESPCFLLSAVPTSHYSDVSPLSFLLAFSASSSMYLPLGYSVRLESTTSILSPFFSMPFVVFSVLCLMKESMSASISPENSLDSGEDDLYKAELWGLMCAVNE